MSDKPISRNIPHWNYLPQSVQQSLENLMEFGSHLENLDDDVQEALFRITGRCGELLGKFAHLNGHRHHVTDTLDDRVALLKKVRLFQDLNDFDLIMVADQMEEVTLPPQTDLLTQHQQPDAVIFIGGGKVAILVNDELVAHRGAGDCIGEMSCLRSEPVSATVQTVTECQIFRILKDNFLATMNKFPQLWRKLFLELTERFATLNERTSEILQHSPQGLLKITKTGLISNEYSSQSVAYLGTQELEGKSFAETVFADSQPKIEGWDKIFPLLFEENISLGFEEVAELLPKETAFLHPDGNTRHYLMSYYPCYNPQKELVAIDIGIEDVTEEREMAKKKAALELEREILKKIYDDPESYLNTLELARDTSTHLMQLAEVLDEMLTSYTGQFDRIPLQHEDEQILETMRQLHTLKGMSGIFLLDDLKYVVHRIEEYVRGIQNHRTITPYQVQHIREKHAEMNDQISYAHSLLESMSTELRRRLTGIVFSLEEFRAFKASVVQKNWNAVQVMLNKLEKVSARKLVQQWKQEVSLLGDRLEKQIRLRMDGDNVYLPRAMYERLAPPLVHILRNCVDHGIEPPAERMELGKTEYGTITVNMKRLEGQFILEIADDGKGLDFEKIAEKAQENPNLVPSEVQTRITQNRVWEILFLPGFSTAREVTDLSGRGVGLDAVQTAITELGGHIEVDSDLGLGTTFRFVLPL